MRKDASSCRAYGRLQVVDVSDIAHPRSVAWYEPEYGGVHNVWVAGDTLYMGAYNAGFRAFDISGELRGDLRAQGREIVHVNTADMDRAGAELGDDLGRGGPGRPGLRQRRQQRPLDHSDGAAAGESDSVRRLAVGGLGGWSVGRLVPYERAAPRYREPPFRLSN